MTQTTLSAATQSLRYFAVTVRFGNPDDEGGPYDIPGGGWRGLAEDRDSAEAKAYDACWDLRLDSTGCYPVYESEEIERYCSSDGWGHIFVGSREETTRWIYDRHAKALVAAQVLNGGTWINLDAAPMADLQESIHDNDACDNAEAFGLMEWGHSPSWQEVESRSQDDSAIPQKPSKTIKQATPATKLVEVRLSALTRVEYVEVVEVPADITQEELDDLVNKRYEQVDGGDYVSDPDYWKRGTCEAVDSQRPDATPTMMAFRAEHGLHIERADAAAQQINGVGRAS